MLENNSLLFQRMEYQFNDFVIESYPGVVDNSFHIKINDKASEKGKKLTFKNN